MREAIKRVWAVRLLPFQAGAELRANHLGAQHEIPEWEAWKRACLGLKGAERVLKGAESYLTRQSEILDSMTAPQS